MLFEPLSTGKEFSAGELIGASRRAGNEIGDPDAPLEEVLAVCFGVPG